MSLLPTGRIVAVSLALAAMSQGCVGAESEPPVALGDKEDDCVELLAPWEDGVGTGKPEDVALEELPALWLEGEVHCTEPATWFTAAEGSGAPAVSDNGENRVFRLEDGDSLVFSLSAYPGVDTQIGVEQIGLHRVVWTEIEFTIIRDDGSAVLAEVRSTRSIAMRPQASSSAEWGPWSSFLLPSDYYWTACPGQAWGDPPSEADAVPFPVSGVLEVTVSDATGRTATTSWTGDIVLPEGC